MNLEVISVSDVLFRICVLKHLHMIHTLFRFIDLYSNEDMKKQFSVFQQNVFIEELE